jgi:hypothetical protein
MRARFFRPNPGLSKPWYIRNYARVERDRELLERHFPFLRFHLDFPSASASLKGEVPFVEAGGIVTKIPILIKFPRDYPFSEPSAFDSERFFKAAVGKKLEDRHIDPDSRKYCLWLKPKSPWNSTDSHSLLHFLDEVIVFLQRQLIYDSTQKWPGQAYDHGVLGYKEFIRERLGADQVHFGRLLPLITYRSKTIQSDDCPCGSQLKYGVCHFRLVDAIRNEIGLEDLSKYFA